MRRAAAVLALVAGSLAIVASPAAAGVPASFFGVVPQALPGKRDFKRMAGTVGTVRMPIFWFEVEPRKGEFDFAQVDKEVEEAAEAGVQVLPFVFGSPAWVEHSQVVAPLQPHQLAEWRGFLRVLVRRYGPGGSFWVGNAHRGPIHRWQIWNEPNFRLYWAPRIEPAGYAKLLRASATTIRAADPGAKIVLAGIAPVSYGMKTWVFMRRLLRVPGVLDYFDFAADHPYSASVEELDFQIEKVRAAMVAGGAAGKPLIVTEFGVASHGARPSSSVLDEAGQARFLRAAYSRLLRMRHRWRIAGAYWFTWRDAARPDPNCAFCQGAGLFKLDGMPKSAWSAYRQLVGERASPAGSPPPPRAGRVGAVR
jgi:polysaccharide biosynthesis protein PslG